MKRKLRKESEEGCDFLVGFLVEEITKIPLGNQRREAVVLEGVLAALYNLAGTFVTSRRPKVVLPPVVYLLVFDNYCYF